MHSGTLQTMTKTPVDMVSAIARGREGVGQAEGKRVHKRSAEALGRVPLFAGLSRRQLHHLAGVADEVRFRPGATVIAEGDLGEALFVIVEGRAKVTRGGKPLSTMAPGEFFGEISLLDRGPRSATVHADTELIALRLFRRSLMRLIQTEPAVGQRLLAGLASRLRGADRRSLS
jgi:CRP/FNR family transcriptional regulator, cyclic AMP receptor protein